MTNEVCFRFEAMTIFGNEPILRSIWRFAHITSVHLSLLMSCAHFAIIVLCESTDRQFHCHAESGSVFTISLKKQFFEIKLNI